MEKEMEKKKNQIILKIILFILFSLIIYFIYRIVLNYKDDKDIKKELKEIKSGVIISDGPNVSNDTIEEKDEQKLKLDFSKLKNINSDTVAWIRVGGTDIDYPVVQSSDNNYYLNHSFFKDINMNGWIFENSNNSSDFSDDNTVLFGHNTNGSTMFSELKGIYNGQYGTSINISIYLEDGFISYRVFSIYLENPNDTASISEYTNSYTLEEMVKKSKMDFGVGIHEGDKVLTLSTCNNITDDRIIMHAKRVN